MGYMRFEVRSDETNTFEIIRKVARKTIERKLLFKSSENDLPTAKRGVNRGL